MKMQFKDDLVRMFFSSDGQDWKKVPATADVSGINRNTLGTWEGVRPGILGGGPGEVFVKSFRLRGLPWERVGSGPLRGVLDSQVEAGTN